MTNSKLEFKGSPQEVTIRELLNYSFDLAAWLEVGETVSVATARLNDLNSNQDVAGVISGLSVSGGNKVLLTLDWRNASLKPDRQYRLWIKATIGSQLKEGFADFKTYYQ